MTSECPALTGGSAWCGSCNPRTRLVDHGTYMKRCVHCHPSSHNLLPQHKVCGGCRTLMHSFDDSPCGKHQPLGIDGSGHRAVVKPPAAMTGIAAQARLELGEAPDAATS